MPEIISKNKAIALGLSRYFTGKPCKYGHISERYIDRKCVECHQIRLRANYEAKRENQPVRRRPIPKLRLKIDDLKFERELRALERD